MPEIRSVWALVAIACSAAAQPTKLSYVDFQPCCLASGPGATFVVGSTTSPPSIQVGRLDSSGQPASNFSIVIRGNDQVTASAVDPSGNLWIVTTPYFNSGQSAPAQALIVKLDPTATSVLFTARFGGTASNGETGINGIAFDSDGNVYLGGSTNQTDFPATAGAFMTQIGKADLPSGYVLSTVPRQGFVAKFSPSFALIYASLIGGVSPKLPYSCNGTCYTTGATNSVSTIAVDAAGVVTVAGTTSALDFPATHGAFQTDCQCANGVVNGFVARFNAAGTGLVWSSFLGAFPPVASSDLGVSISGIALDGTKNVLVSGLTILPNFPTTSGVVQPKLAGSPYSGFLSKFDSTGSTLLFSTYYGLLSHISPPRVDAQGNIWLSGSTTDASSLVLAPDSVVLGNSLIAEVAPDASRVLFSALLPNGVTSQDLQVNPDSTITATGPSTAFQRPIPNGAVVSFAPSAPASLAVFGVADSAVNGVTGTVAPGEFLSIYGTGLSANPVVTFDDLPATIAYSSEHQINLLAPYEIAGRQSVSLQVTTSSGASQSIALKVAPTHPNIFLVLNSDGTVNSPSRTAKQGSTISVLVSGAGVTSPLEPVQVPFTYTYFFPFSTGIGTITAAPQYAGPMDGSPVNLLRVDATIPFVSASVLNGFTVAVQVGDATSPAIPLYVTGVSN